MVCVTSDGNARLPDSVSQYLESALPGWQPVTQSDYDADDLSYFDVSWMLKADFDGDGKRDVCMLLKRGERVSLVAIHAVAHGYRHFVLVPDTKGHPIRTTLSFDGPGRVRVSTADDTNPAYEKLRRPGIVVEVFETCINMLYYWKDGEYYSASRGL